MLGNIFIVRSQQAVNHVLECKKANNIRNNTKIVVVDDMYSSNDPNVICASILLPPSASLVEMVEGDLNRFASEYLAYLNNDKNIFEYMMVLLAGLLYHDIDYIIYVDYSIDAVIYNTLCGYLSSIFSYVYVPWLAVFNDPILTATVNPNTMNQIIQTLAMNGYGPVKQVQSPFYQF